MARWPHLGRILCSLILLAHPSFGATKVYFTSQESVEAKMIELIEQSRSSIDMALFELRSVPLVSALSRAKGRGVKIRLVLDASHRDQDLGAGEVRWLGGKNAGNRGVMHHKFALFDQKQVATGSFNWTPGAEHANYENALLLDDTETVKAYIQEFETLWRRAFEGPPPSGSPASSNHIPWLGKSRHSGRSEERRVGKEC